MYIGRVPNFMKNLVNLKQLNSNNIVNNCMLNLFFNFKSLCKDWIRISKQRRTEEPILSQAAQDDSRNELRKTFDDDTYFLLLLEFSVVHYHIYITHVRMNRHTRQKRSNSPCGVHHIAAFGIYTRRSLQAFKLWAKYRLWCRSALLRCFFFFFLNILYVRYATQTNKSKKQNSHKSLNGKMFVQTFPFNS